MSVSADEPFLFIFIPCLVEFFDVCDIYCVYCSVMVFFFTRMPSVETLSLCLSVT
jgi:hypothetical protein